MNTPNSIFEEGTKLYKAGLSYILLFVQWQNLKKRTLRLFEFQLFFWTIKKLPTTPLHEQSIYLLIYLIYEPTDDFNDFVAGNTLKGFSYM